MSALLRLLLAASLLAGGPVSCLGERGGGASELAEGQTLPASLEDVAARREAGVTWSNRQIRALYLRELSTIPARDAAAKAAGEPIEARARRAYELRRRARIITRAMMSDPAEVEQLRARDLERYGHPDGPTFDGLVESAREKGRSGDAIYQSIIDSAQRTDRAVNRGLGL